MTKENLADRLNGNQYGDEISADLSREAKENGLVVVYGQSDDLIEFEGAIYDEQGAPGTVYVTPEGLFEGCKSGCKYSEAAKAKAAQIKSVWAKGDYSWRYETSIPHATFTIFEDEEKYCKGIVFRLADACAPDTRA